MASSVLCGQAALVGFPKVGRDGTSSKQKKNDSNETIKSVSDVGVPKYLHADKKRLMGEPNAGMEVFKLSKSGKLEPRRLAFSPDNRCLNITTNRVMSLKGLFKAATGNGREPISTKVIDISRIDRILTGVQLSRRFLQSVEQPDAPDELTNDPSKSLTIVYRQTKAEVESSSTFSLDSFSPTKSNSKGLIGGSPGRGNNQYHANLQLQQQDATNIFSGWEFLDLVIPNPKEFKTLVKILKELIECSREERKSLEKTVKLLRYHWIDMGKSDVSENLSSNEWVELCNRLNAPLRRQDAVALFRDMKSELRRACKELGTDMDLDTGLPPWAIAELLNDLQYHSMAVAGFKYIKQDPMLRLWHEIMESDPVPIIEHGKQKQNAGEGLIEKSPSLVSASSDIGRPSTAGNTISGVALLSFIRSQQKEFRKTLEDAQSLMTALQSQKSCKTLASRADSTDTEDKKNETKSLFDERLSKSHFYDLLMSDANDLMDPRKGRIAADDMTHPLSSYWIMSSHDTYLNCYKPDQTPIIDDQMYLAALYRGVRCLEIDVWDGVGESAGEPVIAKERPSSGNSPMIYATVALHSVRQYLQANPKTFPVIINIENHCSFTVQERLAAHIFEILGSIGLIVVPDDSQSIDESDLLPSPASMKGKVLLMGKRPRVIQDGAKVINDDYDDENDVFIDDSLPTVRSREEEEDLETGIVVGFDAKGPIRALNEAAQQNVVKHTPGELLYIAKQELEDAEFAAAQGQIKANEAAEEADKADENADRLIRSAGLSEESVQELLAQIRGLEIDPDEHVALLSRTQGEGVEVQEFFAGAVESARISFTDADQRALRASEVATHSLQKLNHATAKLREAEELLEESFVKGKKVVSKFQKAAKTARDKQEDADHANRRVEKLRMLLQECEVGANSAHNVVNTAMTEAKISEKRATETEARAARAAAAAQKDRVRAEEETRKEEELERQAASLHEQMVSAGRSEKGAKERAQKASVLLERVNDQIRLIESSTQFLREKQDMIDNISEEKKESSKTPSNHGKLHSKLTAKIEERRIHSETIREASLEIGISTKKRQQTQELFEVKAHEWKKQAEIASKLRKASDRSSHIAEDLAEHAEEEREAANLRKVARERAEKHITEKDSYRLGLKTQLAEAERALVDANVQAAAAKKEADRLSHANSSMEEHGHDDILAVLERRKATRDQLLADYEENRRAKEEAEKFAAESKRTYETSDEVYNDAMRISANETKDVNVKRRQDKNALAAVNSAKIAHKQAEHLIEQARYLESVVLEKQVILRRAEEYKERTDKLTEIPTNLAKMTFLHTTKHRYWDKSLRLPNTHCHSFVDSVLEKMAKRDNQDHTENLNRFTSSHLSRSFPSWKNVEVSGELNSDPLFQWSLGCQLVSLNYGTFDEQLLKADGRFRRNGSCGYVLKPDSIRSDGKLHERPESWKIQVLCGQYFPLPASKKDATGSMAYINPMVKINVYGGDIEKRKGEHNTVIVSKNGLNPVFDDDVGFTFKATFPSLAILSFTVWDVSDNGEEEFIAGASMPVACIREGYRSVPLFDIHNTRTGAYEFTSLLVKSQKM
mmetsp:Transcript_7390/g.18142  ORF Transcript_7390/g.18142 Transcript_7390/m.18142 type:complete len:1580 (-) Transcript_7390:162-4901(-)